MKRFLTALAFSAAVFTTGGAAMAEETAAAAPAAEAGAPNPIQQAEKSSALKTANAMVSYGRSKGDALAIIAGVQIMLDVSEGGTLAEGGKDIDLSAILDEAVSAAKGDELVVAKAEALRDLAESQTRGFCQWELWCDGWGYCDWYWVCY